MTEVSIQGAQDLEILARRLKEVGRNDLRKELLRGIREANKPLVAEIREHIRSSLPRRGGLADEIARSTISTRTRLMGKSAGVTLQARRGKSRLDRLNRGVLRHPTYGHRPWVNQQIESGWFDEPIRNNIDMVRQNVIDAMQQVATKLTAGL